MSTSASYATVVQELYVAYFGRPADPTGLQNFEAALAAANAPTTLAGLSAAYATNPAVTALVNAFGDSGESGRLYGTAIASSTSAAQQFVTAVFEDLFNRPPLPAGLAFWSNALLSGSMTPGEAAMEIALGAATADAATFNNKIAAASTFTADLIADNATAGYSGPVAAADGRAFLAGITSSTTAATYQAGATIAIDNMLGISPTPTPTPAPGPTVMTLTVAGDTIHLSNTTAASTVSLSGADLTAYPATSYGTLAGMVSSGILTVTDSGGNFTLNASGNSSATNFNFGTGVVSGSDPASSTGITFGGVTTYVTSTHADTVTLSGTTQNVTASNDTQTINLGGLAYTGALNLTAGTGGTDTINATVGGNLSGATITGTAGHAHLDLVLSAAGTETLSTGEYNLFTSTTAGNITFNGGTGSTDHITFSNAGTVAAIGNVGNYNLSSAGNSITLNNAADNVTGDANAGNDVVNFGALAYTGTTAFGSGGTDTVNVTIGGNISGGSVTSTGATVALVLSGAGTETLNTAEYNLFNTGGISGGSFGGNTIAFSNAGTISDNADVGYYNLSTAGNTITLNNAFDTVTGAASGNDTVNLGTVTIATLAFGAAGADTVHVTVGGNISGAILSTGGASVALVLSGAGTETMSTSEYNIFNAGGISGGSFGGNTVIFSNAGTVTASGNVGSYDLSTAGNTITLNNAADNVTGGASGNDTVNLAALTYTGTTAFGAAGTDNIDVTIGGDISGGTIITGGATVALVLSGAGTETMNTTEYNLFNTTSITGGTFGGDTIAFSNAGTVTANANVGNYDLSTAGNTITLNNVADNVTGAASGSDTVNLAALAYTGTTAFGAAGADSIDVTIGGNISGGTVTSGGATVALVLSGAGTETLNTAEYNLFNATSITGGSFGGDTITFSNAGTVTANANVGNYDLSTAGNTITLTNVADNVTGAASGNDTANLAALAYTGTVAFGAAGTDSIHVTVGGNISGGAITTGGATVALVLSGAGTETMTTAEYNLFDATSITGGTFGGDTIVFSNAGTVTANANVGHYDLSTAGNTITLNNVADSVAGAASGNDTVDLAALTYTGTVVFGAAGVDAVDVTVGGNISGGSVTSTGAAVGLVLSGAGTETLNTAEYNLFDAGSITGGTFGGDTITFSNAGTVTANANVGNYHLSTAGDTITLNNVGDNVTGAASGNDVVNLAALTYTGTVAFGAAGTDSIHVTVGGDISGGTITSGGASVGMVFSAAGTETMTTAEYNLLSAGGFSGGSVGGDGITFSDTGSVTDNANIGNYNLSAAGNTITLNNTFDNVYGASTGGDTYNINVTGMTGALVLGSSGDDTFNIDVSSNVDISGGAITSSGTSADLVLSGSGILTVSSAEAAIFHAASAAIVAPGTDTMNIADASSTINLNAQENALAAVGLQVANNTVNVSVGAASVNAGAAGFNQTITEHALTGGDTFNIDNGGATIAGAADATHYVTINGFNTSSDNLVLTLSGVNQNGTSQSISDSGNDPITATNNGVIYLVNLGALTGYVVGNANDLSSAETNILAAVDPTTASTGVYTFVIDTNNGAAMYQTHFTGSTLDGIQLIGVAQGVAAFNLVGHIA